MEKIDIINVLFLKEQRRKGNGTSD